ncbi:alpha/beta fold hydrolase [Zunongwangia endophytica]|uniref:Alpha/beta fold hydrolase n=1 Tax=Zunongwangia endophytica TaxID=1808945 RepID=A0ABV8HB64_9FLAO|nr:alpha/beta hydrolase [Zunongwangia endophytica]MDN3594661.1 alpha/beta hydrolase [Zunongwangia endophytica]
MNYSSKGKERGTIVCIHGNSSSAKVYDDLLASKDISQTKMAIDLLGHGNNQPDNVDFNEYSFSAQRQFLLENIKEIDDEILLIGNSMGGHLAIEISTEIPQLKGLVIMGTPPLKKTVNVEEAFIPVVALNTFLTENPNEDEIRETLDKVILNKSKIELVTHDFKNTNPLVRKAIAIDLMENRLFNQYLIFTELNLPKYIISGDADLSVNREYLERVKNACNESCKIIDIQNCGHYPSLDQPLKFIDIIKKVATEIFD